MCGTWSMEGENIQAPNEDVEEISSLSYVIGINHKVEKGYFHSNATFILELS